MKEKLGRHVPLVLKLNHRILNIDCREGLLLYPLLDFEFLEQVVVRIDDIWTPSLESKDVLKSIIAIHFLAFTGIFLDHVMKQVVVKLELLNIRKVEYWVLGQEQVFTYVLLLISVFHLFLINLINELLDLILLLTNGWTRQLCSFEAKLGFSVLRQHIVCFISGGVIH